MAGNHEKYDRASHWERVYRDKSPLDVSWYQKEPVLSLQLIHNAAVPQDAPLIDIGGGASLLVDHLSERGFSRLSVLDISANALNCAKNRLGAKAAGIEWYETDVTRFEPAHGYALWHDRAVFHFLTDRNDRRHYVDILQRVLEPDGQLIMGTFAIGGPAQCSGLDIVQYDAEKLLGELGKNFELVEEASEIHRTPADKDQAFAFFRLQRCQHSIKVIT